MSEVLGMTDVQKEKDRTANGGMGGGDNPLIKGALVVLALDAAWFVWEQLGSR